MAVQPFDLGRLFSFLILCTVGRTPWTGDQPVARPLPIHRTTQTQNIRTQTSIPRVGFEPTAPVFEPAKTVHALERAATVICSSYILVSWISFSNFILFYGFKVVHISFFIQSKLVGDGKRLGYFPTQHGRNLFDPSISVHMTQKYVILSSVINMTDCTIVLLLQ
jgi:hypothetical protein